MNDGNEGNDEIDKIDERSTVCYCQCPYRFRTPGVSVVNYDTTYLLMQLEQYRLDEIAKKELEVRVQTAEDVSRIKSEFLARMSHEIRTPINVIIGMSDIMRTDNFDDIQRRNFKDMSQMSHTLLELINDILDFSKIEAGKMELAPVHYNLHALIDHITSVCRFLAGEKALDFRVSIAQDLPSVVYGDETRVRQVLTNILNNAIKYTSVGVVSLSVKQRKVDQSEYIVATVRDTGRGIREKDKASLFDSFAQFDQQMNKGIVGTGLGLPITKQLTELMGGSVTVESEYGLGSTFTAYIPFVPGNPALVEDASRNVRQVQVPSDAKVLAVDDMRLNLNVIQGMLERFGIHPETVESGEEALQKVATLAESGQSYDLIFMDHMMPGMDGLETTRRIRKLEEEESEGRGGKRAVIIAFSANVISGAQEEFLASGMDDCISKPVRLKELNKILVKWLSPERTPETELPQHERRSLDGEKEGGSDCSAKSVESIESTESMDEREPDGTASVAVTAIVPHSFRAQLQSLGLDTSIALEYLGTETALHIYLVRVVEDYEGYVATLRNAFAMGNWGDYKIGIHRLKCVFETMGARDLHARMLALETAAKEGRYEECEHGTPEVLETLADFHGKLTAALAVSA